MSIVGQDVVWDVVQQQEGVEEDHRDLNGRGSREDSGSGGLGVQVGNHQDVIAACVSLR